MASIRPRPMEAVWCVFWTDDDGHESLSSIHRTKECAEAMKGDDTDLRIESWAVHELLSDEDHEAYWKARTA